MAKVGIIGDTHFGAVHPGYLAFCTDTFDAWACDTFVHVGDVVDLHNPSEYGRYVGQEGALDEYRVAYGFVQRWARRFPTMRVCVGNHDERALRLATKHGIAEEFLRPFADLWGTPHWDWKMEHEIDDVLYMHGTGHGGQYPAFNLLKKGVGMSVVMGHAHSVAGVRWLVGPRSRWFAMDVGCGVDRQHPAMRYGRDLPLKPILACGVVLDGVPYHEIMPCGPGERYHRSRFDGRRKKHG